MKKRIWIFNHYAGPPSIATGIRHYNFAKYLQQAGYEVTVFAASAIHNTDKNLIMDERSYLEDNSEGVNFVYIKTRQYKGNGKSRVLNMLDYYRGLFKVCKKFEKPDVILASSVHPLTCVAGIKLAKKFKIPCICEIRDLWPESIVEYNKISRNNPIIIALYQLEKWIYKKADKLIFTMEGGKDYIIERGWEQSIDLSKVYHINNGVDIEEFNENLKTYIFQDEHLNDKNIFKVVYTGSIRTVNDIDKLVDTAEILKCSNSKSIILIWGSGDKEQDIKEKIADKQLSNIVLKGKVDKKYIPSILSQADLCLFHSKQTNILRFGLSANKLFEYLCAGKPILSDLSVSYDIIIRSECGYVTKSQEPIHIAKGIMEMENLSKEEYKIKSDNTLQAAKEYDFKILTNKLIEIIGECIK